MKYTFGIDVGGTTFKVGFFSSDGKMLYKKAYATVNGENGKILFDDLAESLKIARKDLEEVYPEAFDGEYPGVGFGFPGPLENESYIRKLSNIDIIDTDIRIEMQKRIPRLNVYVINDANAAALGEKWQGAGKEFGSALMVTLGTGVGGGLVLGDMIINGFHGAGGEVGHIHVEDSEEDQCGCKGYGCVEQYASSKGLCRLAKRKMEKASKENAENLLSSGLFRCEVTAKAICTLAKEGDELSNEILDEGMHYLGKGLAAAAVVFDPEVYILGGGIAESYEILIPRIEKALKEYTSIITTDGYRIVHAELGNDAGMYGAAKYVFIKQGNR